MVMWRVFCLVVCVSIFSLTSCFAMEGEKENREPQFVQSSKQKTRKRSREESEQYESDELPPSKKQCLLKKEPLKPSQTLLEKNTVSSYSITSLPLETPERRFWKPFKERLIKSGVLSEEGLTSPTVRQIYRETDTGDFFSSCIRFDNKTVFQADDLFDSNSLVLSKNKNWETNLERMKRGLGPVGHRGISKGNSSGSLTKSQIYSIRHTQRKYRIELQHMTQKDTGLDDDPICEMTHDAHMGEDTRHVVIKNNKTGKFDIIASSLKQEEALLCLEEHSNYIIISNVLHFRTGNSLINREKFALWRMDYWKARAKAIEGKLPKLPLKRPLFMGSSSSSLCTSD